MKQSTQRRIVTYLLFTPPAIVVSIIIVIMFPGLLQPYSFTTFVISMITGMTIMAISKFVAKKIIKKKK